ncbi:MAG: hypothetical protein IJM68_05640, partial [Synergistaceae bacterium]|nr:hypothetical protein [Synergistaceae bacterium]
LVENGMIVVAGGFVALFLVVSKGSLGGYWRVIGFLGIIGWGVSVELKPMRQARTHSLDACPASLSLRLML